MQSKIRKGKERCLTRRIILCHSVFFICTMSQSQSDSYTFQNSLDPSVQEFFSKYKVDDWSFNNYENYCRSEKLKIPRNSIIKQYHDNLNKIKLNNEVPNAIKAKVGMLLKSVKVCS